MKKLDISKKSNWLRIAGILLSIAGTLFIIVRIRSVNWEILSGIHSGFLIGSLAIGSLITLCGLLALSLQWRALLRASSDQKTKTATAMRIYLVSNSAKYLPGNIGHLLSRNTFRSSLNTGHVQIAAASVVELAFVILAAVGLVVISSAVSTRSLVEVPGVSEKLTTFFLLVISCIVVAAAILFLLRKNKWLQKFLGAAGTMLPAILKKAPLALTVYAVYFLAIGTYTYLLLIEVNGLHPSINSYTTGIFAVTLSWLAGLVTPGAPAGIGVRETVMLLLLRGEFSEPSIIICSVLVRISSVIADVAGLAIGLSLRRR